ncbi:prepilin-type N-terminal cleavage/methylation domain-containing protein [Trinickia sp.]|uniref:prepilin-type N-terminal cleavage/methylation domain-containing protein n=1 Tax=Trinickia sp. TaxID=2571163 RepID=UPI003F7D2286
MKTSESASGFSMLELVIALAMAAVLAAYAVPSYLAYAARGHRIDAVIALHRAAQSIAAAEAARPAAAATALALPTGLSRVPERGRVVYRLEWLRAGDTSGGYELHAIPAADGPMRADVCGTFVLDGLGVRSNLSPNLSASSSPIADSAVSERCWSGRAA